MIMQVLKLKLEAKIESKADKIIYDNSFFLIHIFDIPDHI